MEPDPLCFTGIITALDTPLSRGEILDFPHGWQRTLDVDFPVYLDIDREDPIGTVTRIDAVHKRLWGHGNFHDNELGRWAAEELDRVQNWPCCLEIEGTEMALDGRPGTYWVRYFGWRPRSLILSAPRTAHPTTSHRITACA